MTEPRQEWVSDLIKAIAGEIKRHRKARGMSTQKLANACKELGMPIRRSVLSNLELGYRKKITVPEILVLAKALEVTPLDLLLPKDHHPRWSADWFTGRDRKAIAAEFLGSIKAQANNALIALGEPKGESGADES